MDSQEAYDIWVDVVRGYRESRSQAKAVADALGTLRDQVDPTSHPDVTMGTVIQLLLGQQQMFELMQDQFEHLFERLVRLEHRVFYPNRELP